MVRRLLYPTSTIIQSDILSWKHNWSSREEKKSERRKEGGDTEEREATEVEHDFTWKGYFVARMWSLKSVDNIETLVSPFPERKKTVEVNNIRILLLD